MLRRIWHGSGFVSIIDRPEEALSGVLGQDSDEQAEEKHSVDLENSRFWSELCGTQLAESLGIYDDSIESLNRFDRWYFDTYPYLLPWLDLEDLKSHSILEVGLGYGSVSEVIALTGSRFSGLDIYSGPVVMANHRLANHGLDATARTGSILDPPFKPNAFDRVIAIGSLHHTGDLESAIRNFFSLLRQGGELFFMVYYAYSYRQYETDREALLEYSSLEESGYRGVMSRKDADARAKYDKNKKGEGAPHTDFISKTSVEWLCRNFESCDVQIKNIGSDPPFTGIDRSKLLETSWSEKVGLDMYVRVKK